MPTQAAAVSSRRANLVDVAPLREAFESSGMAPGEVAKLLNWRGPRYDFAHRLSPWRWDSQRVRRVLGIAPKTMRGGSSSCQSEFIGIENALKIAEILGLDPWEIGL